MHLLFYPNIKKTETKSMLNRNLSLENFKTPGGHWEGQSHSLAALSHHLKVLSDTGILLQRKEANWIHYRINDEKIIEIKEFFNNISK